MDRKIEDTDEDVDTLKELGEEVPHTTGDEVVEKLGEKVETNNEVIGDADV